MTRLLLALVLLLSPAAAQAAERRFLVGSFDRVRVDGPFEVRIATGGAPDAVAQGDRDLLDQLQVQVNGTTLVVRIGTGGWGERFRNRAAQPPVVLLRTQRLIAATGNSGARLTIGRMQSQRVDLAIAGAGAIAASAVDADQLNATLIGTGAITLGGRAARARLVTNGPGTIDATALAVNDLTVQLDGTGDTKAAARYTAQVTNTGVGTVAIVGNAKCTVKAQAGGPVTCGPKLGGP